MWWLARKKGNRQLTAKETLQKLCPPQRLPRAAREVCFLLDVSAFFARIRIADCFPPTPFLPRTFFPLLAASRTQSISAHGGWSRWI